MKNFTLIEGFPDLGLAGTIGAKYLIEKLAFEEVGYLESDYFHPLIRISGGLPLHPARIYAHKKYKVAVVMAEQLIDNMIATPMSREIVAWIKKKGISRVISTSGMRAPEGKSVYAFASNEQSKKILKSHDIDVVSEGVTSGISAMMMLMLCDEKIDAFCILGNTHNAADYNAAAEVVKVICKITKMTIDTKPLLAEAKKLESLLTSHLKSIEENKEGTPSDVTPMYS